MRWIVLLLLLFVGSVESASPPAYPLGIKGETFFKAEFLKRTNNGWYLFWWYKEGGVWKAQTYYCIHGECDQASWSAIQIAIGQAADKSVAADTVTASIPERKCKAEIDGNTRYAAICKEIGVAHAASDPNPPPPPVPPIPSSWTVTVNPFRLDGRQPVYKVVSGKLGGTIPALLATPGEPCDPAVVIPVGNTKYVGYPMGRTDQVTLCRANF